MTLNFVCNLHNKLGSYLRNWAQNRINKNGKRNLFLKLIKNEQNEENDDSDIPIQKYGDPVKNHENSQISVPPMDKSTVPKELIKMTSLFTKNILRKLLRKEQKSSAATKLILKEYVRIERTFRCLIQIFLKLLIINDFFISSYFMLSH